METPQDLLDKLNVEFHFVEGSLRTRSWEDTDGSKNYGTEVHADRIVMLGSWPKDHVDEEEIPEDPED